jgi:outer membrane protein assembly factor BamB
METTKESFCGVVRSQVRPFNHFTVSANNITSLTHKMKKLILISLLLIPFGLYAQDANWRGPNRDGHYAEKGLLKTWPEHGPARILTIEGIGRGFSSVSVANQTIFATGMKDTLDYLSAFAMDGTRKWQVSYGRAWRNSYPDTRSTPIVEGKRIYLVSGTGELVCLSTDDGQKIWSVNVDQDFGADWHRWGVAESPLIVDDMVICTPGGKQTTVVAFDKMTGKLIWKSKAVDAERSYVSPTLYQYKDHRFILAMTSKHLIAVNPQNGSIQWQYEYFKPEWSDRSSLILTNTPIYHQDEIFISKGYDYPSVMLKVDPAGTAVTEKWVNRTLDTHHGGFVYLDGYLYGSNWQNNRMGNWVCLDWETGAVQYETKWFNKGSLIHADGRFYCYEEKSGNVALVKPDPKEFTVVSSFKVDKGSGPYWAHPTIYDGKLFIRHGDVLMVYSISENG